MRIQAWASRSIDRERERERKRGGGGEESTFIEGMAADPVETVLMSFFVFIFFGFKILPKLGTLPPTYCWIRAGLIKCTLTITLIENVLYFVVAIVQ